MVTSDYFWSSCGQLWQIKFHWKRRSFHTQKRSTCFHNNTDLSSRGKNYEPKSKLKKKQVLSDLILDLIIYCLVLRSFGSEQRSNWGEIWGRVAVHSGVWLEEKFSLHRTINHSISTPMWTRYHVWLRKVCSMLECWKCPRGGFGPFLHLK